MPGTSRRRIFFLKDCLIIWCAVLLALLVYDMYLAARSLAQFYAKTAVYTNVAITTTGILAKAFTAVAGGVLPTQFMEIFPKGAPGMAQSCSSQAGLLWNSTACFDQAVPAAPSQLFQMAALLLPSVFSMGASHISRLVGAFLMV